MNSPAEVFDRLSTVVPPVGARRLFGTACVLGAGMAGLVAARVLADHADRVVIVEPDGAGADGSARPGVPQGYQVHVLLPGGRAQLERFYPGIIDQAVAEGAALRTSSPPIWTRLSRSPRPTRGSSPAVGPSSRQSSDV